MHYDTVYNYMIAYYLPRGALLQLVHRLGKHKERMTFINNTSLNLAFLKF